MAEERMKPIIVLPKGAMSTADITKLDNNGICVVEAENPATLKFLDPIPAMQSRTKIEEAAIQLSRRILHGQLPAFPSNKDFAAMYVEYLTKGTPLDSKPTQAEQERTIFNQEKADELRRLARIEAAEERKAIREQKKAEADATAKGKK